MCTPLDVEYVQTGFEECMHACLLEGREHSRCQGSSSNMTLAVVGLPQQDATKLAKGGHNILDQGAGVRV